MSIGGSVVLVCVMLVVDGMTATAAAAGLLATLTGVGGYAVATARKA
jgi:hypothetical protein